jgi:hypothetical protein
LFFGALEPVELARIFISRQDVPPLRSGSLRGEGKNELHLSLGIQGDTALEELTKGQKLQEAHSTWQHLQI